MIERISKWHSALNRITLNFNDTFLTLTIDQLNWKPDPKSWSMAQVIDHLIKTSESYFRVSYNVKNEKFKPSILSKIGFVPKMFGTLILKGVDPGMTRKVKTGQVFEPSQNNYSMDIIDKFNASQEELHKFIDENKEFILDRKVIPSPVNKHIVYHFDTVIDILVNHQMRHYNQAHNILVSQGIRVTNR